MTLAEAFMVRNDLKREISDLQNSSLDTLWEEIEFPIDFDRGVKKHPGVAIELISTRMDELCKLNQAIAVANTQNNPTLRALETVSAKIAVLTKVLTQAERYPGDKIRASPYSEQKEPIEYRWLVDIPALVAKKKALEAEKRSLERVLARNNATIQVTL